MANEQKPVFLSHSYHDKELADKLIKLLTNGCDVSPNDILCTSLPGKDIKVGEPSFINYLKEQLANPKLVILLITENYLASSFCLAELGAAWRMGFECFPLAVKPIARSEIGGVLEVTQAGDISQENYLDQLRDKVKTILGKEIPTAGWTVEKDVFLNGLDALIKGMKKPDVVQRAEMEKVQGQYKYALDAIKAKDGEIGKLQKQIDELKALKDREQVKAFVAKHSSADEAFERVCEAAKTAVGKLQHATRMAFYWKLHGDEGFEPADNDDWEAVKTAESFEEICTSGFFSGSDSKIYTPDKSHPRVAKAESALQELQKFLDDPKDKDFQKRFKEEHQFPASIGNRDFWRKFLAYV